MEIQWDILEPVQNGDVESSSDSDNDPVLSTSSRYKPEKKGTQEQNFILLVYAGINMLRFFEEISFSRTNSDGTYMDDL